MRHKLSAAERLINAVLIIVFIIIGVLQLCPVSVAADTPTGEEVPSMTDNYEWMENDQPRLTAWLKSQTDNAIKIINSLPQYHDVSTFVRQANTPTPSVQNGLFRNEGRLFLTMTPDHPYNRLVLETPPDKPRILLDPPVGYGINFYSLSPDRRYLAYGYAQNGSEFSDLRIMEVHSGKLLKDRIEHLRYPNIVWSKQAKTFFYTKAPNSIKGVENSAILSGLQVYRHTVGLNESEDPIVFGTASLDVVDAAQAKTPFIAVDRQSSWLLGYLTYYTGGNTFSLYATKYRDVDKRSAQWHKIADDKDGIAAFFIRKNKLFFFRKNAASGYDLLVKDLNRSRNKERTLLSWTNGDLIKYQDTAKNLFLAYSDAGTIKFLDINLIDGYKKNYISIPDQSNVTAIYTDQNATDVYFVVQTWTQSPRLKKYSPKSHIATETGKLKKSAFEKSDIISIQTTVLARDGVSIPLTLIFKRGSVQDGSHRTWLTAYGAYGQSTWPYFDATRLYWLQQGGIVAIAHIRGGGERGPDWHKAGMGVNKVNSINDFIDTAKYLITQNYTRSDKLVAVGQSAGGIVVGMAIVEQPDLFAAAAIDVGILNPLRLDAIPIGSSNAEEIGSINDLGGKEKLQAIDAFAGLKDGVRYPSILLTVGLNDNRVSPWQSAKFAARLTAINQRISSPTPVLMIADPKAGHSAGNISDFDEKTASILKFLLWRTE